MSSTSQPVASQSAGKMPGETVRALVSLWLLFHFFGIALAIATDSGMGTSQLLARIKRAPFLDQYLYALWLDVGYNYQLTYGGPLDADHVVEAEVIYPDDRRETRTYPPEGARGERLGRYKALVQRAAAASDPEMGDSTLAANIGGAILNQTGAKEVIFRVRRHSPLSMQDMSSSEAAQRDPNNPRTYSTIYTASVTLSSRGQPQVRTQAESPRDVAPVTNPSSSQEAAPTGGSSGATPLGAGTRRQATPLPKPESTKQPAADKFGVPAGALPPETGSKK